MARRALRKLDPTLDLTGRLLTLEQLSQPFDPATLFARRAPLEIEMGSGKGLFLSSAAAARPDRNFLGVEIAKKYAAHCAARCARAELANAVMISGDGLRLFREFLPAASAAAVHVYFPDPWWKKRHRKRRVLNELFLLDVHRVLQPAGTLHFWTDVEEYFLSTLELIAGLRRFDGPLAVPEARPEHDLDYRTHFERRKRREGVPIFRSEFRRRD